MQIPGYQIEREIGKGGMATVFLAVQESLERSVVLKVLDKDFRNKSEDMTQRFLDEGRILASLHHPNIVTIYDIGVAGDEMYISMEYVQGGDLKNRMQSHILPTVALDIVSKIGSALASAHSHNIIHRDVKPANILFRNDDTPLLTDFGIAKQTDDDKDLTSTGIFLGSPNYVSPEQADSKRVDGRSDIYSLGCIFYEMLTGYKPYHSNSVIDIVIQHKTAPVPSLSGRLAEYQPLLEKMMAKNLEERFASADEMVKAVEEFQASTDDNVVSTDFDITGSEEDKTKKTTKKKSMMILIVLLIISATFFFGLQFIEIKIKSPKTKINQVTTNTVLNDLQPTSTNLAEQTLTASQTEQTEEVESIETTEMDETVEPISEEVTQALAWLGRQSLEEFKLTYPAKDNAYYYFSRLLEIQPDNRIAYEGILAISERYAILAEQSLIKNEIEKTRTYIEIGLRIDPQNQALLSLQKLVTNQKTGVWQTLKSFF